MSNGRIVGRYIVYDEFASGGMATVHFGRLCGAAGFTRTVAIKCLHRQHVADPDFVAMFRDEAILASRIHHPNVIPTLDVVSLDGEVLLVLEYVHGESLAHLLGAMETEADSGILTTVVAGILHGLHAAHEATNARGEALGIIHRDVSPQNILVGADGVPRLLDFGIARAAGRLHMTREGQIKGKLPYMAPEQLRGGVLDRRADVYGAAVVLWETLAGRPLFRADTQADMLEQVLLGYVDPPSSVNPRVTEALDAITMRGLERDPAKRFPTAREMALALERCERLAPASDVGAWVERTAGTTLSRRSERLEAIERAAENGSARRSDLVLAEETPASGERGAGAVSGSGRSARRRSLLLTLLGLVALVLAMLVMGRRRIFPRAAESRESPSSTASASSPQPDETPAVASPSLLATTVVGAESPRTSPSAVASAPTRKRPAPPPPVEDCTVPYVVDPTGRRIYKRSCL